MVRSNSAIWGHFLPNCTITETISPIVYNLDKNVEERERAFRYYCSSSALKLQPKLYSPTFRHFLSSLGTDNSPRIKVKALAFQKKFQKSFHFGMQIKLGNNSVSRSYAKFSWQLHFVTFFCLFGNLKIEWKRERSSISNNEIVYSASAALFSFKFQKPLEMLKPTQLLDLQKGHLGRRGLSKRQKT